MTNGGVRSRKILSRHRFRRTARVAERFLTALGFDCKVVPASRGPARWWVVRS